MLELKTPLSELNRFRQAAGLKPIVWKQTTCLSCRKNFESKDYPRQRLCGNCRSETDDFLSFEVPRQDLVMIG